MLGGIAWALGNVEADVTPNLEKVAPPRFEPVELRRRWAERCPTAVRNMAAARPVTPRRAVVDHHHVHAGNRVAAGGRGSTARTTGDTTAAGCVP